MRIPEEGENLVGKLCVCSMGRPAIVVGTAEFRDVVIREGEIESLHEVTTTVKRWVGLGIDGKGCWSSSAPIVLEDDPYEFYIKAMERFNGRF